MSDTRPNILFLFSDQHRADALSCAGDPNVETPHLDALAGQGIRLANAYSNTPLCSPFRATLYTGRYITTHGVTSLFVPLLPRQPTLPQILREAGYHTSHMGKWHLAGGDCPSHFVSPYFRPGWDDWLGWDNSNEPFATEYGVGDQPAPLLVFDRFQTDALADLTIEWLRVKDRRKPWFHVMSFEPPHPDRFCRYVAPEPYMAMYRHRPLSLPNSFERSGTEDFEGQLRGYYAMIRNMDDNIGRVLRALEETGQRDNTIVVYFSDHGDLLGNHGLRQKSRPEEESARIPFIVRWPRGIPASRLSPALFSGVDILPTVLGLAGVPCPESVEGRDASPVLRGEREAVNEDVLLQFESNFFSHRRDESLCFRALRHGPWKYTVFLERGPSQLFNLDDDPNERRNLIADPGASAVRTLLDTRLRARCAEIGDSFFERVRR